jgi:hypothetical protein
MRTRKQKSAYFKKTKTVKIFITPVIIIFAGYLSFIVISNIIDVKEMNTKFDWEATWNATKLYPMELISGAFIFPGEGAKVLRSGSAHDDWGSEGSISVGNTRPKPVPIGLYIHWYSYTEDKFYKGSFDLPYDKILTLFREGFNMFRAKKHTTYSDIVAGLAPDGTVGIWLSGKGRQVEVGYFKAPESEYLSAKEFLGYLYDVYCAEYGENENIVQKYRQLGLKQDKKVLDNLMQHGISFGLWDTYRERFNIRPVIMYEDTTCITDEIYIKYYNGEKETLSLSRLEENPFKKRARIKYLNAYWSFGQIIREVIFEFDEQEIFETYRKIYDGNPDYHVELQIQLDKENHYFSVFLVRMDEDNFKRIQLNHIKINWYPISEINRYRFEIFKNKDKN